MQTTLRINDELYRRAKIEAAKEGVTLTRFIEQALQLRLQQKPARGRIQLSSFHSGQPFSYEPEDLKRLIQETDLGGQA